MIGPKTRKPTPTEEKQAYAISAGRDDLTCQRCLRWCGAPQQDHRQNRQPGNTVASNLQTLGLMCHQWKSEHPADALAEGWAVPRWADPARWPARRYFRNPLTNTVRKGWCLYDNDGGVLELTDEQAAALLT